MNLRRTPEADITSWLRPNRPSTPWSINKPTPGPPSMFFSPLEGSDSRPVRRRVRNNSSFSTRLHPAGFKQLKFASCTSAVRIKHFVTKRVCGGNQDERPPGQQTSTRVYGKSSAGSYGMSRRRSFYRVRYLSPDPNIGSAASKLTFKASIYRFYSLT